MSVENKYGATNKDVHRTFFEGVTHCTVSLISDKRPEPPKRYRHAPYTTYATTDSQFSIQLSQLPENEDEPVFSLVQRVNAILCVVFGDNVLSAVECKSVEKNNLKKHGYIAKFLVSGKPCTVEGIFGACTCKVLAEQVASKINAAGILCDRFSLISSNSPKGSDAIKEYCAVIFRLEQKERHHKMSGLPSGRVKAVVKQGDI